MCDPASALRLAGLYLAGLDRLGIRWAGGAAYEGILLTSQAALLSALRDGPRVEGFYCRDSAKSHGAGGTLEGRVPGRGEDAALLAGFVCDGAPLLEAARLVRQTGARVPVSWFWGCAANAALTRYPGALWFMSSSALTVCYGDPAAGIVLGLVHCPYIEVPELEFAGVVVGEAACGADIAVL